MTMTPTPSTMSNTSVCGEQLPSEQQQQQQHKHEDEDDHHHLNSSSNSLSLELDAFFDCQDYDHEDNYSYCDMNKLLLNKSSSSSRSMDASKSTPEPSLYEEEQMDEEEDFFQVVDQQHSSASVSGASYASNSVLVSAITARVSQSRVGRFAETPAVQNSIFAKTRVGRAVVSQLADADAEIEARSLRSSSSDGSQRALVNDSGPLKLSQVVSSVNARQQRQVRTSIPIPLPSNVLNSRMGWTIRNSNLSVPQNIINSRLGRMMAHKVHAINSISTF